MAMLQDEFKKYYKINCFTMAMLLPLDRNIVIIWGQRISVWIVTFSRGSKMTVYEKDCECVWVCFSVHGYVCIDDDAEIFEFDFVVCVYLGI